MRKDLLQEPTIVCWNGDNKESTAKLFTYELDGVPNILISFEGDRHYVLDKSFVDDMNKWFEEKPEGDFCIDFGYKINIKLSEALRIANIFWKYVNEM